MTAVVRGGALAALTIDCFDSDELRDSDVPPSAARTAVTAGAFLTRPAFDGPATALPFPARSASLTDPPKPSTVARFAVFFCLPDFARALLIDSVTVSLA